MPLKKRMNVKWVRLRIKCEFVRTCLVCAMTSFLEADPFGEPLIREDGRVSGRYRYKYNVSTKMRKSEKPAAVAKGLAATVETLAKAAPSAGPKVKAIEKQAPTSAIVAPRCFSSLMSAAMAVASCTFPSLNPPTTLLARNVRKSVAATHSATELILPAIDHNSAVRRPYLSDNAPMNGEAIAWRKEKRLPRAPPRRTMSYRSLIGREKDCLYLFRPRRMRLRIELGAAVDDSSPR